MYRLFFIFLLFHSTQSISAEQAFLDGLSAYKEKNFSLAQEEFKNALAQSPNNTQILLNLGLAEQQLGNNGAAIAAWRKLIVIEPTHSAAKSALNFMHKSFPEPKAQSLWEIIRRNLLNYVPLNLILGLFFVFLILSGWQFINYFNKRQKHEPTDNSYPNLPIKASLLLLATIISLILGLFKVYDFLEPRGTIIEKEVQLRVSPNPEGLELTNLSEAQEIILRKKHKEWIQIKTLNGVIGWIKESDFFQTQGRQL